MVPSEKNPDKQAQNRLTLMKSLNIAIEFGFIIVLPLIAFGYLGKYFDRKYHTTYLVLVGIFLALLTSSLWFYRTINRLLKDLQDK